MEQLKQFVAERSINIAVITVPAEAAQEVADQLVEAKIKAIWNFAPKDLRLPDDIVLQRTDLATSFAVLSAKCRRKIDNSSIRFSESDYNVN